MANLKIINLIQNLEEHIDFAIMLSHPGSKLRLIFHDVGQCYNGMVSAYSLILCWGLSAFET